MALSQDIANKSIREQITALAEAFDKEIASPAEDISALTSVVGQLQQAVRELNVAINGVQEASPTDPAAPLPTP